MSQEVHNRPTQDEVLFTMEELNARIASKIGPPGGVPVSDLHVFGSRVILSAALEVLREEINDIRVKLRRKI